MQARHDDIQFRQNVIVEIQLVFQNVHLAAGQQPEIAPARGDFIVYFFDFQNLFAQAFCIQPVRLKRSFRVVGDRPICQAQFFHVGGDFFQRIFAVAPVRVIVQRALQIRPFDEARQIIFFRRQKFAVVLAQFRRHINQI